MRVVGRKRGRNRQVERRRRERGRKGTESCRGRDEGTYWRARKDGRANLSPPNTRAPVAAGDLVTVKETNKQLSAPRLPGVVRLLSLTPSRR